MGQTTNRQQNHKVPQETSPNLSFQFRFTARHLLAKARKWPGTRENAQLPRGWTSFRKDFQAQSSCAANNQIIKGYHSLFIPAIAEMVQVTETQGHHLPHFSVWKTEV